VCLCLNMPICSDLAVLASSSSLWGKKLEFKPFCLWQLSPDTVIPALEELSVCLLLRSASGTEWTAFVYKAPKSSYIELGLQGKKDNLTLWLFGNETKVVKRLSLNQWHSLCITWSGKQQTLQLYINGTKVASKYLEAKSPTHLASGGTLTLGRSHFVMGKGVQPEYGNSLIGDISQFRIWSKQWSEEELQRQECTDADVISWDERHWKSDCSPPNDHHLKCSKYPYFRFLSLWASCVLICCAAFLACFFQLKSVFPSNVSISDTYVTPSYLVKLTVKVEPAADVGLVQAEITAKLSFPFASDFLNAQPDPESILVLSAGEYYYLQDQKNYNQYVKLPTQSVPAYPGNTTEEPVDINKTLDKADIFFRVNLVLGITGFHSDPLLFIKTWLLCPYLIQCLHDLLFKDLPYSLNRYICNFHVQEDYLYSVSEVQTYIENTLNVLFSNESITLQTVSLKTKHIEPSDCLEERTSTIYGKYFWARTFPQDIQTMRCQDPPQENAYRLCKLEISTDTTKWAKADMTNCNPRVTIPQIENVTVTTENAGEVVETIQDLVNEQLSNSSQLSPDDLTTVVGKLSEVVDVGSNSELGANIVTIVADILISSTDVTTISNVVLNLTSKMGDTLDFHGTAETIAAPSVALSLCNVETQGFSGLTFGVSSLSTNLKPQVFVDEKFVSDQIQNIKASISVPPEVQNFFSIERNTTRLQFQFFATDRLFQDPYLANSTTRERMLNSYIVSASINDSNVRNLSERVVVTLSHQKATQPDDQVHCVFWDFQNNGGRGGWNEKGCETQTTSHYQTRCLCDHLTHFAVLLDVSRTPISDIDSQILTIISYTGCGISAIFLGVTLLTYLAFEKLRRDNPSKILINLSAALLGLCMLFLLDGWLSSFSNYSLCIATAATLHYFLLASFTWMGLEALHMYLALVKVFNIYVPSYILKFCAVGWGLPLVIVSLVLAIDKDSYGSSVSQETTVLQSSDPFCWVNSDEVYYVTVVCFILLILLANLSVFIVVLIQIKRMRLNKPSANSSNPMNDLRAVASLTVLLGLTWSMGFFSFGPGRVVMMYLFSILNTLH
ncbi:hypothetical protein NL108_005256, partial [Boleophthalmus pectinirostris]